MYFRSIVLFAAALTICAAAPGLAHTGFPAAKSNRNARSAEPAPEAAPQKVGQAKSGTGELGEQSKLEIIRYVSGEFAKATHPLPHEKTGYKIAAGKPLDEQKLQDEVRRQGAIAAPGDTVQITKVEFRSREIAIQINGGGKKKFHLREHLQIGMGDVPPPAVSDHPGEGRGTTIVLDYGRALPDLSPNDVKRDLSVLLDFSKQHSAAVNWMDTLPPEMQQAIRDHRALVGMDQEMVIAALGRPDHKVREKDPSGTETEDWIYGTPPAKTTFVTFAGDKVVRVKVFNDPDAPSSTGAN